MAEKLSSSEIITRTTALKTFWGKRDSKMKSWYEQLKMVDLLAQRNMESFVGNDPRTSFNLISSLLNQRIPHRLPPNKLSIEQVRSAGELSLLFDVIWENIYAAYRQRGRYLQKDIIDYLLVTGWYSVFAAPTLDGSAFVAEAWNPITVYPKWSNILAECAHIFTPGEAAIQHMVIRNGWKLQSTVSSNTVIRDYWYAEQTAAQVIVHNSILIGNEQVKIDTVEPRFKRIPIFVFPIGGLPDTGDLSKRGETWKEEIGQSLLATNENIYKSINKWWTFMMQLLRDTAQARTFEKSTSAKKIVGEGEWDRRGGHFKLGPQDEVGFIQPPAIPVELRSIQLDLEAMKERGIPNATMLGSIQQRMTSFAMSQAASATNQAARYFHQGIVDLFSDMDNFFYDLIIENNYKPYELALPSDLPPIANAKLSADYPLRIPGDLTQRATTARMLNPEFSLSEEFIIEESFPEIKNPSEEIARVTAGKARKDPIFAQIALVEALRKEAILLRGALDSSAAELYEKAAERLEQQITGEGEQPVQPGRGNVSVRPEAVPPNQARPPRGEVQ